MGSAHRFVIRPMHDGGTTFAPFKHAGFPETAGE
jgi:hypothetical protein